MSNVHNWEYSPEPRLEGLLQQLKYIKWENIDETQGGKYEEHKHNKKL